MNTRHNATLVSPPSIDQARHMTDGILEDFFENRIALAALIDDSYATLWRSIARLGTVGGKRIRPYVLLLAHQAWSDQPAQSVAPVAAALELLHLAMLVHDDIIDRDLVRYGIDNVSGQQNKLYAPHIHDAVTRRHFSDSAAILAGDVLISEGYQMLLQSSVPLEQQAVAISLYGEAIFTVAGGELLDTESAFRPFESVDALTIARYKTAHYSFVTPLVMGARLGGADSTTVATLTRFGETLGIAYQLVDDLLGVFGNTTITGKSTDGDLKEAKHTYMIEQFRQLASPAQRVAFDALFGRHSMSVSDADQLRVLLIETGAKQRTESTIDTYIARSLAILDTLTLSDDSKDTFKQLVARVTKRAS